jgi:hypothetical protein
VTFQENDVVVLLADKQYPDLFIPAGTLGTVVAPIVTLAASLVHFGLDSTTRLILDADLILVHRFAQGAKLAGAAKKAGFSEGDRVALREDRDFGDAQLPQGSRGTVMSALPTLRSSLVDFDDDATDRVVSDGALKKIHA